MGCVSHAVSKSAVPTPRRWHARARRCSAAVFLVACLCLLPGPCGAKPHRRRRWWSPSFTDSLFIPFGPAAGASQAGGDASGGDAAAPTPSPPPASARDASGPGALPPAAPTNGETFAGYGPDHIPIGETYNTYKQLLARSPGGAVAFSEALNMTLPAPWDIVNLTRVVRDNLEPTVRFWRDQAPRRPRVRDLFDAAVNSDFYRQSDTRRVVVIRNGVITFPLMPPGLGQFGCDAPGSGCNPQLVAWLAAMKAAVKVYGLKLPDVVLSLNVQDGGSPCAPHYVRAATRECIAPIISVSKALAGTDVVAPMLLLPDANVTWRHAPWGAKAPRAFFRGAPSCGDLTIERGVCARTVVARLGQLRPDVLDAGLVEPFKQSEEEMAADPVLRDGKGPLPVLPRAPWNTLALHRYLINLDGHSAAYRFATLLATNSLVFKQDSTQVEWFYNSTQPWRHYVPILDTNRTDVLDRFAWAEAHPSEARQIVERANRFALTYTTYYARIVYWLYALEAYKGIFEDQDEFFATHGAGVRDLVREHDRRRRQREAEAAAAAKAGAGSGSQAGAEDATDSSSSSSSSSHDDGSNSPGGDTNPAANPPRRR